MCWLVPNRHKVAPVISPGKSWEGVAAELVVYLLFIFGLQQFRSASVLHLYKPATLLHRNIWSSLASPAKKGTNGYEHYAVCANLFRCGQMMLSATGTCLCLLSHRCLQHKARAWPYFLQLWELLEICVKVSSSGLAVSRTGVFDDRRSCAFSLLWSSSAHHAPLSSFPADNHAHVNCLPALPTHLCSGDFFPGHGGVLDRFDSFFLAAPILRLILESTDMLPVAWIRVNCISHSRTQLLFGC